MKRTIDNGAQFISVFLASSAILSFLAAGAVYLLARGLRVVVISQTKVTAEPVVDYLWPVLMLAVMLAVLCCAVTGMMFYSLLRKKIGKPSKRLQTDLQRMASGDLTRTVEFWSAEDLYDVAVDLEKNREALKNKMIMVSDRYNSVKNFLDQKNFEVNDANREILKQKLQSVDEQLKGFKIRLQPQPELNIQPPKSRISRLLPQVGSVVNDAEEMIRF